MILKPKFPFTKSLPAKKAAPEALNHWVFIKQGTSLCKVVVSDILYVESDNVYIYIYTTEGKWMVRSTISQFLETLDDPYFVRVHRSFAVNLAQVISIGLHEVKLLAGSVPLSKNYRHELLARLKTC